MKIEEVVEQELDESFNRIISRAQNMDFAIITAYKTDNNKQQNIIRNRNLRGDLDKLFLGVHPLVGHWRECTDNSIPYQNCAEDKLVDAIERSYFVARNETPENKMDQNLFKSTILSLASKYQQNAVVLKIGKNIETVEPNGNVIQNLGTGVTVGKISQAYSQYVRNLDKPFIFETDFEELKNV